MAIASLFIRLLKYFSSLVSRGQTNFMALLCGQTKAPVQNMSPYGLFS